MGESWVAMDGRTITDEMVERWERELETGDFFDKGVPVGGVVDGPPPSTTDGDILKMVENYRAGRLKTYTLDEVEAMLGLDEVDV